MKNLQLQALTKTLKVEDYTVIQKQKNNKHNLKKVLQ